MSEHCASRRERRDPPPRGAQRAAAGRYVSLLRFMMSLIVRI